MVFFPVLSLRCVCVPIIVHVYIFLFVSFCFMYQSLGGWLTWKMGWNSHINHFRFHTSSPKWAVPLESFWLQQLEWNSNRHKVMCGEKQASQIQSTPSCDWGLRRNWSGTPIFGSSQFMEARQGALWVKPSLLPGCEHLKDLECILSMSGSTAPSSVKD